MRKIASIIVVSFILVSCTLIPSKWDSNQSYAITDLRQIVRSIDCDGDVVRKLNHLNYRLEWLMLYNESKGTKDVGNLVTLFNETVQTFRQKSTSFSKGYCTSKKEIMIELSDMIARAIQRRIK